jgi:hypothetical protein
MTTRNNNIRNNATVPIEYENSLHWDQYIKLSIGKTCDPQDLISWVVDIKRKN